MSGRGGAWLRAAPVVALGVVLACVIHFVFVPSVVGLYESRGSPAVSVDSSVLSVAALIANLALLVLMAATRWRAGRER